jgi:hypothetical protein
MLLDVVKLFSNDQYSDMTYAVGGLLRAIMAFSPVAAWKIAFTMLPQAPDVFRANYTIALPGLLVGPQISSSPPAGWKKMLFRSFWRLCRQNERNKKYLPRCRRRKSLWRGRHPTLNAEVR